MGILNFILVHWEMILTAAAVIAVIIYLFVKGEKRFLKYLLFRAVTDAEAEYSEPGTGVLKLSAVISELYANMPEWLKAIISEKLLIKIVEDALKKAKEIWAESPGIMEYITGTAAADAILPSSAAVVVDKPPGSETPGT